ncbi:hypothetical protein [Lysinibacillus sp. NPDC056185]|uniref:hypothetical protein n=1 Tax=Lysinibacillus sp. NPDC056185 TaxID=3345739 RepID=UPI0039F02E54
MTGFIRRSRGVFRRLLGSFRRLTSNPSLEEFLPSLMSSFRRLTGFPSLDGLSVAYGVLTIPFRIPSRLTKKQKQFSIIGELLF